MEPPPHHYHLYVPSSSLAIVSERAQREAPQSTKIWEKTFTFL